MKGLILEQMEAAMPESSKADVERAFDAAFGALRKVIDTNAAGARVPGFGTFKLKHRKSRNGRNPQTGATIVVPAKDVITFHQSKTA